MCKFLGRKRPMWTLIPIGHQITTIFVFLFWNIIDKCIMSNYWQNTNYLQMSKGRHDMTMMAQGVDPSHIFGSLYFTLIKMM